MIAMVVPGMSYWDAYMMPVQIRKYMINLYIRTQNREQQQHQKSDMAAIAKKAQAMQTGKIQPNFLGTPQR